MSEGEVLVKVENVSKKFCKDLKTSLWYGVKDLGSELLGLRKDHDLRNKEFWAVKDVSFELKRGDCLGLIGHNGAGKSTLLKMLNGLIKPDQGMITMKGRIGALIELGAGFNPILTGRENVYINGQILGLSKKEIDQKFDSIVSFAEMEEFIDTPVQNYSSGMKVKLGFAIAVQMEPDVLIIDEVLAVGDVGFRMKCFNAINSISNSAAVIIVSHSMAQISRVATSIFLMNKGKETYHSTDVATGIEKYFDLFQVGDKSVGGNGKATLNDIRVSSSSISSNDDVPTFNYYDDLIFELDFSISEDIKKYSIHIGIMDKELKTIAQCFSRTSDVDFENLEGSYKLKVVIPKIPLAMGTYSVNINFMENSIDEQRGDYLAHYRAVKHFKIKSKSAQLQSPIQLKGEWELKQAKVIL